MKLSEQFLESYRGQQPPWGPIGYFIYKRTYSRRLDDNGTFEEYWQTIRRVVETVYTIQREHCDKYKLPWNAYKAQKSAQEMYRRMWEFKFLPGGRGLWGMYLPLLRSKGGGCLFNCSFTSTEDIDTDFSGPFTFMMDFMMLGVGVGADLKGAEKVIIKPPKIIDGTFTVEDTRESWVELIGVILESFLGKQLPKHVDYSKVRKEGELIRTFGGTSSGPGPLKGLVDDIIKVLTKTDNRFKEKYPQEEVMDLSLLMKTFDPYPISSSQIADIFNIIGRCVVSGNVRRSAELLLGSPLDVEFRKLKQNEYKLSHHRWVSNNSISAKVGMDYSSFVGDTAINGEPGYIWLDNARNYGRLKDGIDGSDSRVLGFNPCAEIQLENRENCNLVDVFLPNHSSYEDFLVTLKYAYLYAKSVTLIPTHDQRTNAVIMRNRRIGTGVTGIIQAFNKHGKRNVLSWLDKGYGYLKDLDKLYSDWLCIPKSIRLTTVKPAGSTSLLPGVTPGIHYPHSEYYIRNVRISSSNPLVKLHRDAGYPVKEDTSSPGTSIISSPVKEDSFVKGKDKVTMWEQLENAAQLQYYWSDNSVSITVTVKPEEANEINEALQLYETRLKSVSFLPLKDHGYDDPPYVEITAEEYEKLSRKIKSLKPISEDVGKAEAAYCDSDSCSIT